MSTVPPQARRHGRHELIGEGVHSWVYHRRGSAVVVQRFRPDAPELTIRKVQCEYRYLRAVFDPVLPDLIPAQRLIVPGPQARLAETLLVKQFVEVAPAWALRTVSPRELPARARADLAMFVSVVRGLLAETRARAELEVEASLIPDIIDPPLDNLVIDTAGRLRLLDTNRLISTVELREREVRGQLLSAADDDVPTRIYLLVLRRLMWLQHRFLGAPPAALIADPLLRRYLPGAQFAPLFAASAAAGEPFAQIRAHATTVGGHRDPRPPRPRASAAASRTR